MRAVGITQAGGPEVVELIDRPERAPDAGEVQIRVAAAAVNPTDIGLRAGGGGDLPAPWTPGMDAAGTVAAVGAGVERLRVGDEVMAVCSPRRPDGGAQVELLTVPEASAVAIPDGASVEQAATLPMNGLTAILGLDMLDLPTGATLAVTGAAGLLGSYVVTLAKERGLRVVADAKPEDEDAVRAAGADEVIPRSDDFPGAVRAVAPDGADAVYDCALLHEACLGAIRDGGQIAVVRGWDGPTERDIAIQKVMVFERLEDTAGLEHLRESASAGRIALRVAGTYPPERAGEAQERLDAGGVRGRLLIAF